MKPTIPETGRVIKLDGDRAVVLLHAAKSCKGCGAAAIGLCKPSGGISTLIVKNTRHARLGDTVTVSLDRSVQWRGFLLAYGVPILSFLMGTVLGHIAEAHIPVSSLDVLSGFAFLIGSAALSFRKLKHLDKSSSLVIKHVVSGGHFEADPDTASFGG